MNKNESNVDHNLKGKNSTKSRLDNTAKSNEQFIFKVSFEVQCQIENAIKQKSPIPFRV